jgi:hypothetical protein
VQLVDSDVQGAHTGASEVVDGVGDGRGDAGDANPPDSFAAHRVEAGVVFVEQDGVDICEVGVGWKW